MMYEDSLTLDYLIRLILAEFLYDAHKLMTGNVTAGIVFRFFRYVPRCQLAGTYATSLHANQRFVVMQNRIASVLNSYVIN